MGHRYDRAVVPCYLAVAGQQKPHGWPKQRQVLESHGTCSANVRENSASTIKLLFKGTYGIESVMAVQRYSILPRQSCLLVGEQLALSSQVEDGKTPRSSDRSDNDARGPVRSYSKDFKQRIDNTLMLLDSRHGRVSCIWLIEVLAESLSLPLHRLLHIPRSKTITLTENRL